MSQRVPPNQAAQASQKGSSNNNNNRHNQNQNQHHQQHSNNNNQQRQNNQQQQQSQQQQQQNQPWKNVIEFLESALTLANARQGGPVASSVVQAIQFFSYETEMNRNNRHVSDINQLPEATHISQLPLALRQVIQSNNNNNNDSSSSSSKTNNLSLALTIYKTLRLVLLSAVCSSTEQQEKAKNQLLFMFEAYTTYAPFHMADRSEEFPAPPPPQQQQQFTNNFAAATAATSSGKNNSNNNNNKSSSNTISSLNISMPQPKSSGQSQNQATTSTTTRGPSVGWDTAILVVLVQQIRTLSTVDGALDSHILNELLREWRTMFLFLITADEAFPNNTARRRGALVVLNAVLAIVFHERNFTQARSFVQLVDKLEASAQGDPSKGVFGPCGHIKSEVIKLLYFQGRFSLYVSDGRNSFEAGKLFIQCCQRLPPLSSLPPSSSSSSGPAPSDNIRRNKLRSLFYASISGLLAGVAPAAAMWQHDSVMQSVISPLINAVNSGSRTCIDYALSSPAIAPVLRTRSVYVQCFQLHLLAVLVCVKRLHTSMAEDFPGEDNSRIQLRLVEDVVTFFDKIGIEKNKIPPHGHHGQPPSSQQQQQQQNQNQNQNQNHKSNKNTPLSQFAESQSLLFHEEEPEDHNSDKIKKNKKNTKNSVEEDEDDEFAPEVSPTAGSSSQRDERPIDVYSKKSCEIVMMLSELCHRKWIRGYVSGNLDYLVLAKTNPFPRMAI